MASLSAQARRAAAIRYQPAVDALLATQAKQHQDYVSQAAAERASAAGLSRSLAATGTGLRRDLTDAQSFGQNAYRQVAGDLTGPYRQAAIADQAAASRDLATTKGVALGEVRQRQSDAHAGAVYAIRALTSASRQDAEKIAAQLLSTGQQAGSFAAQEYDTLLGKQRDYKLQAGKAAETRRHNLHMEGVQDTKLLQGGLKTLPGLAQILGGAGKQKPPKTLGVAGNNSALDAIGRAKTWVDQLAGSNNINASGLRSLLTGGGSIQVKDPNNKTRTKTLSIPSFGSEITTAAIDLHRYGGLRPSTAALLRRRGIKLGGPIGGSTRIPTYRSGKVAGAVGAAGAFGGSVGSSIASALRGI